MGHRWIVSTFAVAALAASVAIFAQNAPQSAAHNTADLSGVWHLPEGEEPRHFIYFTKEEPPMLPWAAAKYQEIRKGVDPKRPELGRTDLDPAQYPYCLPFGMPRVYAYWDPLEIVQTPAQVDVMFETSAVQRIYTDGRKNPKGGPLSFMGDSAGHWEGDTLVAETINVSDITWFDTMGHQHTDALRIEQRFHRPDHDTLRIDFLFDDPKTFSKPWTATREYKLSPSGARNILTHYVICEDKVREEFTRNVLGKKKEEQ